jgi:hypothetical protein
MADRGYASSMSETNSTAKKPQKPSRMSVAELDPKDFAPISKEKMGKAIAKRAMKPKKAAGK